ncbi:MAG: zinc-ribbon domain-containing protein [Rhodocyclaceae bacterium]|nr:zinc-ribbon domain-containing protein [Rhodocyclaceae bacterium]MBX3671050.1 zinc-ribbon domain-containing protein [Rhodocyclaceae bacterium]
MLTRCPACATTFRITPAQLRARRGQVRCGRCRAIFDALDELSDEAAPEPAQTPAGDLSTAMPAPALASREAQPPVQQAAVRGPRNYVAHRTAAPPADNAPAAIPPEVRAEVLPDVPSVVEIPPPAADPVGLVSRDAAGGPTTASAELPSDKPLPVGPAGVAEDDHTPAHVAAETAAEAENLSVPRRSGGFFWGVLALLAASALAGQAAIHWRAELAQKVPATRKALESACAYLGCTVGLPRDTEALSIETSDMQFDGPRLRLSASLRNRAHHVQEWPSLYLTLTDTADRAVVRRVLTPGDYLSPDQDVAAGFPADGEIAVNLLLDTSGVAAAGYRLYLFHP